MRLTPEEPEIPEIGGFTDENDLFGYCGFADRLTNLVGNIEEPLVLALDGPWGSGKSIFVKQWAGLLRERGAFVIQFDAFGNDYNEDAFLAISAEIYAAAKKALVGNESKKRRYLNKAKKAGVVLAPIALRVAARASTAGLLSLEDVEAGGEALQAAVKALGNETAKTVEKVISERLRKASEEREALEAFREALSELARTMAEQRAGDGEAFPLVFIIDELDRCRPPFALSVIERIKHLFSVPHVCFVLVTHLPQLEQAAQGLYGTTLDAHTYLEKFYHLRVVLPENREQPDRKRSAYIQHLWDALRIRFPAQDHGNIVYEELLALATSHDLSLRTLERIMTHIALVCAAVGSRSLIVPPIVAGLCVMRQTHPELYEKARRMALTWEEAREFLQPAGREGVEDDWTVGWWKYAIGEEVADEQGIEFGRLLAQHHVRGPENVIPFMTKYIDELAQR